MCKNEKLAWTLGLKSSVQINNKTKLLQTIKISSLVDTSNLIFYKMKYEACAIKVKHCAWIVLDKEASC